MGFSFIPKDENFFALFNQQAALIVEAGKAFSELALAGNFNSESIKNLEDIEHKCDNVTHDIIDRLNRTFITPFDREDIHNLAHKADNIIDMLYSTAKRMCIYKINEVNPMLIKFAGTIEQSIQSLTKAFQEMNHTKNYKSVLKYCIEVNHFENIGDDLKDQAIGDLLEKTKDPITFIIWKEAYEGTEIVLDICEDVANVIESIIVKQA